MDNTRDPIIDYLAYFNQIDKHFDKVLQLNKFLPYNEKIKRLIEWHYDISWFISLHKYELKFIWELRNHITHGIKLDGHNYAIPSPYAINKIKMLAKHIKSPPRCFDVFKKTVFFAKTTDRLKDILLIMKNNNYSHVPIYDKNNHFSGVLTDSIICYRLINQLKAGKKSLEDIIIGDIPLWRGSDDYLFVSKNMSIYEIDRIFTSRKQEHKKLWAIFISNHGKPDEKILWIITSGDVALVDSYIVH